MVLMFSYGLLEVVPLVPRGALADNAAHIRRHGVSACICIEKKKKENENEKKNDVIVNFIGRDGDDA